MPDSVLTILKFCFLALLYLFFIRVLRAVWVEVSGRAPTARTVAANYGSTPAARPARSRVGDMRAAVGGKNGTKLKVIEPAETRGKVYDLTDELTMGRATGCHITLDDTYVSQLHAASSNATARSSSRTWGRPTAPTSTGPRSPRPSSSVGATACRWARR